MNKGITFTHVSVILFSFNRLKSGKVDGKIISRHNRLLSDIMNELLAEDLGHEYIIMKYLTHGDTSAYTTWFSLKKEDFFDKLE